MRFRVSSRIVSVANIRSPSGLLTVECLPGRPEVRSVFTHNFSVELVGSRMNTKSILLPQPTPSSLSLDNEFELKVIRLGCCSRNEISHRKAVPLPVFWANPRFRQWSDKLYASSRCATIDALCRCSCGAALAEVGVQSAYPLYTAKLGNPIGVGICL